MKLVQSFSGHKSIIRAVDFAPDGTTVLTGSHDGAYCLWDVASGKCLKRFGTPEKQSVKDLFFLQNSREALVSLWGESRRLVQNTTFIIDLENGTTVKLLQLDGTTLSASLSQSNRYVLTSGASTVTLWDLHELTPPQVFQHYSNAAVAFHPDEGSFFIGFVDGIEQWDVRTATRIALYKGCKASHNSGFCVSNDGQYLAAGDKGFVILNLRTGQLLQHPMKALIRDVSISPDSKTLTTVGQEPYIRLWELESGQEIDHIMGHGDVTLCVRFSPDGRYLLTGGWDSVARLWEL